MIRGVALLVVAACCAVVAVVPHVVSGADRAAPLRRAIASFERAESTPRGFDNGLTRTRRAVVVQSQLADVASSAPEREAAQANDLLGVLAWGPAPERSVAAFTRAVVLDPSNLAAKTNLELALRALVAHGTRPGSTPGTGTGAGRRGAGAGSRGKGY